MFATVKKQLNRDCVKLILIFSKVLNEIFLIILNFYV